ncbi:hypothetical protein AALB39_09305 [Lachnospiraceae bacterium 54-53]
MIVINAPLKAEVFQRLAEESGLTFIGKKGMKMMFKNQAGNDGEKAAELKMQLKANENLAAVFFSVTAEQGEI